MFRVFIHVILVLLASSALAGPRFLVETEWIGEKQVRVHALATDSEHNLLEAAIQNFVFEFGAFCSNPYLRYSTTMEGCFEEKAGRMCSMSASFDCRVKKSSLLPGIKAMAGEVTFKNACVENMQNKGFDLSQSQMLCSEVESGFDYLCLDNLSDQSDNLEDILNGFCLY